MIQHVKLTLKAVTFLSASSIASFGVAQGWFPFIGHGNENENPPVNIDQITVQSILSAVNEPSESQTEFMSIIDSMTESLAVGKVRNPFSNKSLNPIVQKPKPDIKKEKKKPAYRRPTIMLNGIIWDEDSPYAILNDDVYGVGESVNGYTVQSISDSLVVLYNEFDFFPLKFHND